MEDDVDCRSEASVEITESASNTIDSSKIIPAENQDHKNTPKTIAKKTFSSPCTPKVNEGFGDSNAAEVLEHVPQAKQLFDIVSKIGEGTFSNVYLAKMKHYPTEMFALKHIIPTSAPLRVENELRCLQELGGNDNIIGLRTVLRHQDHAVFVLPYFPHAKFQEYYHQMSVCEIREYVRNLFIALKKVHSKKIIHRDVKPSNFLYCRKQKKYCLVDFGLAMVVSGSQTSSKESKGKASSPVADSSKRRSARLSSPPEPNKKKKARLANPQSASSKTELSSKRPAAKFIHGSVANKTLGQRHTRSSSQQSSSSNKDTASDRAKPQSPVESYRPHQLLCPLQHVPLEVCTLCSSRSGQNAPRAGTPGFRSPEVLLKHPHQTTAVDIWSAGVILLSILSGRYPFFRAQDDLTALSQILIIKGTNTTARVSHDLGKDFLCSPANPPLDLKTMCQTLRRGSEDNPPTTSPCCSFCQNNTDTKNKKKTDKGKQCGFQHVSRRAGICVKCNGSAEDSQCEHCKNCGISNLQHMNGEVCRCTCGHCCYVIPEAAYDLLNHCLDLDPGSRISAIDALQHPFLTMSSTR